LTVKYLNNPKRVSVGGENVAAKNIKQEVIELKSDQKNIEIKKYKSLLKLYDQADIINDIV